jgi:hypothetical protein
MEVNAQTLILEQLASLHKKLDDMSKSMNEGTRRMDTHQRDISDLRTADAKTDSVILAIEKRLDGKLDSLEKRLARVEEDVEPVVAVTGRMKTMLYIAIAGMGMLALFPTLKPYLGFK